jgi:hypothetical protein
LTPEVPPIANGSLGPIGRGTPHSIAGDAKAARGGRAGAGDRVELSRQAQLMERLRELPEVRRGRINELRVLIESGRYETEDRLGTAIERMLSEISDDAAGLEA